jgi:hypothetical protein
VAARTELDGVWQAADVNDADVVRALLAAAGITPSDEEIDVLAATLPGLRSQVDRFYAVETGELPPASMLRVAR